MELMDGVGCLAIHVAFSGWAFLHVYANIDHYLQ